MTRVVIIGGVVEGIGEYVNLKGWVVVEKEGGSSVCFSML